MAGKVRDVNLSIQKCVSNIPRVATRQVAVKMVRNAISSIRRYAGTQRNEVFATEINVNFITLKALKRSLSESQISIGPKTREVELITSLVLTVILLDLMYNMIFRGIEAGILLRMVGKIMGTQEIGHTLIPPKLLDQTVIF